MGLFSVFTASFFPFFIISILVIIHELGHFLMCYLLGGKILKISIYPYGGISKFRLALNISIVKEFLVLISGPLFQILAFVVLSFFYPEKQSVIASYHYSILFFNLLPIYPLDGGKLLNLLFQLFLPYRGSFIFSMVVGYSLIFVLAFGLIPSFSLNLLFICLFLLVKLTTEYRQIQYLYERFLLERYLHSYSFKKSRIVDDCKKFRRNYRHLVKQDGNYYLEKEILEKKYKNC